MCRPFPIAMAIVTATGPIIAGTARRFAATTTIGTIIAAITAS